MLVLSIATYRNGIVKYCQDIYYSHSHGSRFLFHNQDNGYHYDNRVSELLGLPDYPAHGKN